MSNNSVSVDSFIEQLSAGIAANRLQRVIISGYASPEGPAKLNVKLANQRRHALADIITSRTAINPLLIDSQAVRGGQTWEMMCELVINDASVPNRDKVLEILGRENLANAQRLNSIKAIDDEETYKWLLKHIFPKLRTAQAIAIFRKPEAEPTPEAEVDNTPEAEVKPTPEIEASDDSIKTTLDVAEVVEPDDSADRVDSHKSRVGESYRPRHLLALKTNLLYYPALMPNLELEYLFHDNWSVAAEGNIAWWAKESAHKCYRIAIFDAEARYWVKPRAPWHGLFVGVFAGGGAYDLENGGNGHQGEGAITGLSVGYMWPISRSLSLEAAIGGGYLYARDKEYKPYEGHYLYQRTKAINYFGPLKVKFSLVWRFLDKNKLSRPQPQL